MIYQDYTCGQISPLADSSLEADSACQQAKSYALTVPIYSDDREPFTVVIPDELANEIVNYDLKMATLTGDMLALDFESGDYLQDACYYYLLDDSF